MKKPSKITSITAKINKFICPVGYKAITMCGTIYVRNTRALEEINKTLGIDSITENHETIHVKQAVSTRNSWLLFYLTYLWQWIVNLPLLFINSKAPYRFISFELEAYANEDDFTYQDKIKNGAVGWKDFNKLSLSEKKDLAKQYYKNGRAILFRNFVKNYVLPVVENHK